MANTLGTLSGIQVVQEILSSLLVRFPLLSQLTTDFSMQNARFNQQISTRVIVPTVAVEHNTAVGYVATDRTAIDVNITINKQAEHTYEVTDREQSQTNRRLVNEFAATAAHALGTKIMNDFFATVTAAIYPLSFPSAPANFDAADIRRIKTLLNKAFVPDMGRFICLNSDYAEGVGLDNLILANPNTSNQGVISSGQMPNLIHGFAPSEYASLPTNNENLGGIAGNREAVIMATRVPDQPNPTRTIPGEIATVTEPNSGLAAQYRQYYDMKLAKDVESITLMYGFAAGLSEAGLSKRLVRITS